MGGVVQASPLQLGAVVDLTNKAIQKIFKKESEKTELQLKKYYNFRTTTDLFEKDSSMSGLYEAEFTAENAEIMEDVQVQGFDQTYEQQAVDILVPYTYMVWKFGIKKRDLANIASQINNALNRKKERLAAERLTNGFTTNYSHVGIGKNTTIANTGGDALEPWNTAHTCEDGGTSMNNIVYDGTTYSLPFDYAAYKAADRTASLWTDPRGNPRPGKLDTLVCKYGSSVHHKAMEILGAIKSGKIAESNDNDGSALPVFKIIALDYLTEDAYWGMFDSSRALSLEEGFQHIESEANNLDPVNVVYKTRKILRSIAEMLFNNLVNSGKLSLA
ncbi:MAG: hypothetical protein KJ954_14410 [Alphaproteobacteria bacterium]|nr:hypothetical protein [Alphaproteobacteria bacterium]